MTDIKFYIPRYNELPKVPLYKEQVITYLENILKENGVEEYEKILTPTMINNYVKQRIVPAPEDKKYNETHLAYFIMVCVLKQVFSMQEISYLIRMQMDSLSIESAYDYFCSEIEEAIKAVFITRDFLYESKMIADTKEAAMIKSSVEAFAHKLYIQYQIKVLE